MEVDSASRTLEEVVHLVACLKDGQEEAEVIHTRHMVAWTVEAGIERRPGRCS